MAPFALRTPMDGRVPPGPAREIRLGLRFGSAGRLRVNFIENRFPHWAFAIRPFLKQILGLTLRMPNVFRSDPAVSPPRTAGWLLSNADMVGIQSLQSCIHAGKNIVRNPGLSPRTPSQLEYIAAPSEIHFQARRSTCWRSCRQIADWFTARLTVVL